MGATESSEMEDPRENWVSDLVKEIFPQTDYDHDVAPVEFFTMKF